MGKKRFATISISDGRGATIAFVSTGLVFSAEGRSSVAKLRAGNLYTLDGALAGVLTPSSTFPGSPDEIS
jgi:hypothetical protein